mmetsp:Transcript_20171/g.28912  ORF Transcript_20171/g.28912 Transcript_20171/m.28912 type:complete len:496 (+) Transcript_20171:13-1500(+)
MPYKITVVNEKKTMKLDVTCMRYLGKDDYRVLVAIEMGMRNHEMVPVELIDNIAKLRHGGTFKILSTLLRYKLVAHTNNEYNGYRLSYLGYDILALHALLARGVVVSVGNQIGVGKESDIFEALDCDGNGIVIKLHRLGRTSFRAVRRNRDYMMGKRKASWLYMSRLAAVKEYAFMKALFEHGFPTPVPLDQSRHIVAMSRITGCPLSQLRAGSLTNPDEVYKSCLAILKRLAEHGLVHCDFNEFNLMIDPLQHKNEIQSALDGNEEEIKATPSSSTAIASLSSELSPITVTLIDFPQMVSVTHPNAEDLFQRDLKCLRKFFAMKMHCQLALQEAITDDPSFTLQSIAAGFQGEHPLSLGEAALANCGLSGEDCGALDEYLQQAEKDEKEGIEEDDVNELEEKEEVVVSVFSLAAETAAMGDRKREEVEQGDDEEDNEEEEGEERVDEEIPKSGGERSKHHQKHHNPKKGSRNMTKKINKYGRIVRSDRNLTSSY